MSVATLATDPATFARFGSILAASHMTAIVETEHSTHTVVSRPQYGVRMIHEDGRCFGAAKVAVVNGSLVLFAANGKWIYRSTPVKAIHILTN